MSAMNERMNEQALTIALPIYPGLGLVLRVLRTLYNSQYPGTYRLRISYNASAVASLVA